MIFEYIYFVNRILLACLTGMMSFSLSSLLAQVNPCCATCECYLCADYQSCFVPLASPDSCTLGGEENCGKFTPSPCLTFTENYYPAGLDAGCVPIDGGLGFLIAGGLGMGVIGTRRRQRLELLER